MSSVIIRIVKRATGGVCFLLFCISFFLTGCGQGEITGEASLDTKTEAASESGQENEIAERLTSCEFTDVYLRISEPYGSSYILNGNVSQTKVEGHTYQFASDIDKEDCISFIQAQETLCAFLEEKGISTKGTTYRVLSDYSNWTDSEEETAYFGLNTMESWEQLLTTIQVSLGDYTNYGYLYALANYVAGELGWETDDIEVSTEISIDIFKEDPSLLNLVYPCFDLMYEDEDTISYCKSLALQILEKITDPYACEEAFLEEIEAWAQEQGIDFTPTYLQFAYYSESCPLKMETQYLEIFKDSNFVAEASYVDGQITYNYFENVSVMLQAFEWLDVQLEYYCEKLNAYPENLAVVELTDEAHMESLYHNAGGLYTREEGEVQIYASDVITLGHEYLHLLYDLLVNIDDDFGWRTEVISYYYTACNYEPELISTKVIPGYQEKYFVSRIGKILEEPTDYVRFLRVYYREMEDPQYLFNLKSETGGGYKCAFGEYFVRTYGEEAFINSMLYPSQTEDYTGKGLDEIIDDWCVDMADPEMDEMVRYENFCTMW